MKRGVSIYDGYFKIIPSVNFKISRYTNYIYKMVFIFHIKLKIFVDYVSEQANMEI